MIARRSFLAGILASAAGPAIITRSGILMPVKSIVTPVPWWATAEPPTILRSPTRLFMPAETYAALMDSVRLVSTPGGFRMVSLCTTHSKENP